jgi:ketosteroid isomerase-like protein
MTRNIELVQRGYRALARRDWDEAFRDAHPDFEFEVRFGPNAGTHRGRQAVQRRFDDLAAAFDLFEIEPEEFFERGEFVVVFVRFRLRPKNSGAEFEMAIAHVWRIENGKARSLRGYERDAPEVVGVLNPEGAGSASDKDS